MNNLRIITVILVLAITACDHKPPTLPDCLTSSSDFKPDDCPGNGSCSFEFYPESKLEVLNDAQGIQFKLKEGKNLVFHFEYTRHVSPLITDAGYSESIYFEVKSGCKSFLIREEDLEDSGAIFGRFCFCPDFGYFRISQGCIFGNKINDRTWNVSLNLTATSQSSAYNRMKQRDFLKKERPE